VKQFYKSGTNEKRRYAAPERSSERQLRTAESSEKRQAAAGNQEGVRRQVIAYRYRIR